MVREKACYTYKISQLAVVGGQYSVHSKWFSLKKLQEQMDVHQKLEMQLELTCTFYSVWDVIRCIYIDWLANYMEKNVSYM